MKEFISIKQLGLVYSVAMLTTACSNREVRQSPLSPPTSSPSRKDSETSIATQGPEKGSPAPSYATGVEMGEKNLSIKGSTSEENATKGGSVATATTATTATTTTTTTTATGSDSRGSSNSSTPSSTPVTNPTTQTGAASNTPASNDLKIDDSATGRSTEDRSTVEPDPPKPQLSRKRSSSMSSLPSGTGAKPGVSDFTTTSTTKVASGVSGPQKSPGQVRKIWEKIRHRSDSEPTGGRPKSNSAPPTPIPQRKKGDKKLKEDGGKPKKA